ncbi:MAG: LacI family DNA-binding transcriptional regulator [Terriglobia bacterium]
MAKRKPGLSKKKVTMQQVARRANASLSSVSRVLHSYPGIHPELRERIGQAIQELGYSPSAGKQRWIKPDKRLIYFLLVNRELHINPYSRILQAIERETNRRGDLLIYKSFRLNPDLPAKDLSTAGLVELQANTVGSPTGAILTGPTFPNLLEALEELAVPFVLLGNNFSGSKPPETDAVFFDGYQGAYESTRYLIDLGHRNILFIGDPTIGWFSSIYQGYADALSQANLAPIAQTKTLSDSFYSNGYFSVQMAFEQDNSITAIFAGCDEIALGASKALNDRDLSVPRDVSLIGFDDEDYASFTVPPLSTVRIDVEAIGRELITLLYAKFDHPERTFPAVRLPSNLIKRGTCRPAQVLSEAR